MLGAVLLSDTALPALIIDERLQPEDFYREAHGLIFQAMLDLHTVGEPVDALTLVEHLKQAACSSASAAAPPSTCSPARCPAVGNVRQYARIVRENAMLRRLLHASYEIQARVHSARGAAARARRPRRALDPRGRPRRPPQGLPRDPRPALDRARQARASCPPRALSITGTPSGFEDLDSITGGFQPGNLIILAARPGMGKSALMANFAEHAALTTEQAVALFSLEMSRGGAGAALHRRQASIKGDDLRKGKVPPARWAQDPRGDATGSRSRRCSSTTPPTCRCSTCARRRAGSPSSRPTGSGWC